MEKIKPLLLLFTLAVLISCTDNSHSTFINYPITTHSFTTGNWHISSYTKHGKEESETYKDYKFSFDADNSVIASGNDKKTIGKWLVNSDCGTDDSPPTDIDLVIEFKTSNLLSHLNGDYYIVERTLSKLKLKNINSQDKDLGYLEFEKKITK